MLIFGVVLGVFGVVLVIGIGYYFFQGRILQKTWSVEQRVLTEDLDSVKQEREAKGNRCYNREYQIKPPQPVPGFDWFLEEIYLERKKICDEANKNNNNDNNNNNHPTMATANTHPAPAQNPQNSYTRPTPDRHRQPPPDRTNNNNNNNNNNHPTMATANTTATNPTSTPEAIPTTTFCIKQHWRRKATKKFANHNAQSITTPQQHQQPQSTPNHNHNQNHNNKKTCESKKGPHWEQQHWDVTREEVPDAEKLDALETYFDVKVTKSEGIILSYEIEQHIFTPKQQSLKQGDSKPCREKESREPGANAAANQPHATKCSPPQP